MSIKLSGKVAIVTGASKGIGAEIALQLAKEGASVVVNYATSKEGAERVVAEIVRNGGKAIAAQASMANEADIKHLFAETLKKFGKVDILVNNAGVYDFIPLAEVTAEAFHRMFNINVLGLLLACREAAKHFGNSGGNIVNISSAASEAAIPTMSIYAGTKGAVNTITRCLATELGPRKIRVNAVDPGLIDTEGTESKGIMESEFRKEAEVKTPLGRLGKPEDIAPAVVFLASDDASWITGETLFIRGGFHY